MNVFVTGGTGYLGVWLVRKLAENGHRVKALVRNEALAGPIELPGVSFIKGDLHSKDVLRQAMKDVDQVYHLAAFAKLWAADKKIFHQVNTIGTENVLEAALANGVGKVVVVSSAGNYGPSVAGIITEKTVRTLPFFNEYERTKHNADEVALAYSGSSLNVVIAYPTRIYGPSMVEPESVTMLIEKMVNEQFRWVPGNGKSIGNYVYVHDVVQGLMLAMERGHSGEKYILGGDNLSYNSFYQLVAESAGWSKKFIHIPLFILKVLAAEETFRSWFGMKPLITVDWLAKISMDWEVSSEKAKKELGYTTTGLAQAIAETVSWVKQKKSGGTDR